MGRILAAFVVAASLLTLAPTQASAWACFATGLGSSGFARAYDIIDAKVFALRQCERNSPAPVCVILWCRPRGRSAARSVSIGPRHSLGEFTSRMPLRSPP
jgi:hypothetical protein